MSGVDVRGLLQQARDSADGRGFPSDAAEYQSGVLALNELFDALDAFGIAEVVMTPRLRRLRAALANARGAKS